MYIEKYFNNKYIDDMYIEKYINNKKDDFEIKIIKKTCFYPPCLNEVIGDNYCHLHNKDMI